MSGMPVDECIVIAEIGQNHNGDINIAKELISIAAEAKCDYVKFAKRTTELSVPKHMRDVQRETPWGIMSYMDYRNRLEFGQDEYEDIDDYCKKVGIPWFASASDEPSLQFLEQFDPPFCKIPSAKMHDDALLVAAAKTGRIVIASTGMCSVYRILHAIHCLGEAEYWLAQCTSCYPAPNNQINLNAMNTLWKYGPKRVGYSGHEIGLQISLAAVAMGASFIERHITLSHSMWGSDQAASIEPEGLRKLVRDIRVIESAMGDGVIRMFPCERETFSRLAGDVVERASE